MQSKARYQRDRGPLKFDLGKEPLQRRGWAEFKPRQIEADKLLTSLILAASANEEDTAPAQAVVLTDYSQAHCKKARRFLWDRFPLLVFPHSSDLFWELLHALDQPTLVCHVAEAQPDFELPWLRAATLIGEMDPVASVEFLRRSYDQWQWEAGQPILYEEMPGRTRMLELESRTQRAWTKISRNLKKLSPEVLREEAAQMQARSGWGLLALHMTPGGTQVAIRTRTVELSSDGYGLGFGRHLAHHLNEWLQDAKFPEVRYFVSTIPFLALNADFCRHFEKPVAIPDIQFGWNPVQTALEIFALSQNDTIIIGLGQFPLIHLVHVGAP